MQKKYPQTVKLPTALSQSQLHRQLGEFANWMKRPKDAGELCKDRRQSVPPAMLPMPF